MCILFDYEFRWAVRSLYVSLPNEELPHHSNAKPGVEETIAGTEGVGGIRRVSFVFFAASMVQPMAGEDWSGERGNVRVEGEEGKV